MLDLDYMRAFIARCRGNKSLAVIQFDRERYAQNYEVCINLYLESGGEID